MKKLSFVLFLSLLIGCLFVSCNSKNSTDLTKLTSKSREVVQAFSTEKKDAKVTMSKKTKDEVKELLSSFQSFNQTESVTIMSTDGIVELGDLGYTLAGDYIACNGKTTAVLKETQSGKTRTYKQESYREGENSYLIREFGDYKYSIMSDSDGKTIEERVNGKKLYSHSELIDFTIEAYDKGEEYIRDDMSPAELEVFYDTNSMSVYMIYLNWIIRSGELKTYTAIIQRDPSNDANTLKLISACTETDTITETVFTVEAEVDGHSLKARAKIKAYSDSYASARAYSAYSTSMHSLDEIKNNYELLSVVWSTLFGLKNYYQDFLLKYLLSDDFWSAKGKKGLEILSFEYDGTAYDVTH